MSSSVRAIHVFQYRIATIQNVSHAYNNKAWVPVDTGFEVQVDKNAKPAGLDKHRTGAIYDISLGSVVGQQQYQRGPILQPGTWNDFEIEISGDNYKVRLNGQQTTAFTNNDSFRGKSPTQDQHSGYFGIQAHTGRIAFRNIRIK